jgi:hypothetical protein
MSPVSNVLIGYWQRLPAESCAVRRENLTTVWREVRSGMRPHESLVIFALGDVDDEIVVAATRAYLESASGISPDARAAAIDAAIEWVRRGLALNGGAIFHALLARGDASITERLASLRLALPARELEALCRCCRSRPTSSTARFLEEWRQLVEAATDRQLRRQHAILAAALDESRPRAKLRALAVA